MKKLLILLSLTLALVLTSCKEGEQDPKSTATKAPANTTGTSATAVPTLEPTAAPTTAPTPAKEPLGDKLGLPQDDAEVIFFDDYEEGMASTESVFRYSNGHEVVDGKLYLSIYGGVPVERADTYAVDYYCEAGKDYEQYQFHLTFKTSHDKADNNPWMAAIVGVRVYEPSGGSSFPKDEDSGLYIAVTQNNKIVFYHGNPGHWPSGACRLDIPQGFGETSELCIVDTGNRIYYYQAPQGGERVLFMTIDVSGDQLIVYDSQGNEVYSAENNLKQDKGGYFKIFNHFGKTEIDEFSIKAR